MATGHRIAPDLGSMSPCPPSAGILLGKRLQLGPVALATCRYLV